MEYRDVVVLPLYNLNEGGVSNRQKIDIGETFSQLSIRVTGNLVVTVAATLTPDGILNLIKNIIIELSAGLKPKSISGEMLYKTNIYDEQTLGQIQQPAVGVATNPFFVELVLPFITKNGFPPEVTLFNSKRLKDQVNNTFNLEILLGSVADVISAGTATLSGLQAEVVARQVLDMDNIYRPVNAEITKSDRLLLSGAGSFKTAVDLKSGNKLKRLIIMTEDAGGVNSDALVSQIRVRKGLSTFVQQWGWNQLKADNKRQYGIEAANQPVGVNILEIDVNQDFTSLIDTAKESQVYLEVDTLASTLLTVIAQEIID